MKLQVFSNAEFESVRSTMIKDEPWFVDKDVAEILGYKDTVNALKAHVDSEDKRGWQITTQFGTKETTIINESGLSVRSIRTSVSSNSMSETPTT